MFAYLLTWLFAYFLAWLLAFLNTSLFACLLTSVPVCLLTSVLTSLFACLLSCLVACLLPCLVTSLLPYLLAYFLVCLLTYFRPCLLPCLVLPYFLTCFLTVCLLHSLLARWMILSFHWRSKFKNVQNNAFLFQGGGMTAIALYDYQASESSNFLINDSNISIYRFSVTLFRDERTTGA